MELGDPVRALLDHKGWGALSIGPDQTVFDAIQKMAAHAVGALVVVEDEALGRNLLRARLRSQSDARRPPRRITH